MNQNIDAKRQEIIAAIKDSQPIYAGFVFVWFAFGAISQNIGNTIIQTLVMTVGIFAIPLQMILTGGAHIATVKTAILMSFVINFRLFLMSASLSRFFTKIPLWKKCLSIQLMGPSLYTVAHLRFSDRHSKYPLVYFLWVGIPCYLISIVFSMVGYYLGFIIRYPFFKELVIIILPIYFAILTGKRFHHLKHVFATIAGFVLAAIGHQYFAEWTYIFAAVTAGIIFMWGER